MVSFIKGEFMNKSIATRFKKGHKTWNKGIPMNPISKEIMISKMVGKHFSSKTEFKVGQVGKKAGHWQGGRTIDKDGYVCIYSPNHPFARGKYVREHRLVMEKHIGRYLLPSERVHHINGIKTDNRLCNLKLLTSESEHQKLHYKTKTGKWKLVS
jgi:hypothetical protein